MNDEQRKRMEAKVLKILKSYEREMEGYSYSGSNPGVPEYDYEDIVADVLREFDRSYKAALEGQQPTVDDVLDHPCKHTCSGWKQGYDSGQESTSDDRNELMNRVIALRKRNGELEDVIAHAVEYLESTGIHDVKYKLEPEYQMLMSFRMALNNNSERSKSDGN